MKRQLRLATVLIAAVFIGNTRAQEPIDGRVRIGRPPVVTRAPHPVRHPRRLPEVRVHRAAPEIPRDQLGQGVVHFVPASDPVSQQPAVDIPPTYVPWWQQPALKPLRDAPSTLSVDVDSLIIDALRYSAQVRAISDNAVIAQTAITRAAAEFDVSTFVESKFVRTSVPTGSVLDAGAGVPRLREEDWFVSGGLRRKNQLGGRFEVAQQLGTRDSNSQFFFPGNQGNARLTLSYNQPILNGAGRAYNNSLVVLADLDTRIASHRTATELQDHLLEVTEAMWELYHQRSILLQKRRHLERAHVILIRLEKRSSVDSLASQIARARAAVAMRRSELIRAAAAIRNAEARIRALVNSPTMLTQRSNELIPNQVPTANFVATNLDDAVLTALEHRPEINAAMEEIEAARVRRNVAQNELMPVLDLVLETYVSGLQDRYDVAQSWGDQFYKGEPSYTAGLLFEVPLHRRAARANLERRQLELRQLSSRLQAAIELLHAEVEVAVREVDTSYREMQAKYISMKAAETDVNYLQRRWEELPGDDRAASFLLEDLLDSQDRFAFEEMGFARAQVDYTVSLTRLNRATGTLLKQERVEILPAHVEGLPAIEFERSGGGGHIETVPPPRHE